MSRWLLVITALVVLLCWSALAYATGVQARFSLETPSAGPFPSNLFTVPDPQQLTGLRVQLPPTHTAPGRGGLCQPPETQT